MALAQHGFARATKDVDINVFVQPEQVPGLLETLRGAGLRVKDGAEREATEEGWFSAWLGAVRDALRSRKQLPFLGESLWFLSAEALCVFKLLFFRTKDLADLERLVQSPSPLDRAAVRSAIVGMMGEDDERVRAWDGIVKRFG